MVLLIGMALFGVNLYAEVSKDHVGLMLDRMVEEKAISEEEAIKAKIKMNSMNSAEWSNLNLNAGQVAAQRNPASVNESSKFSSKDLGKIQFEQIEEDIEKILPEN